MHIAHVQGTFSPEHGGPTHSLTNYCLGQVRRGHRVSVWALEGFPHTSNAKRLPAPIESHVFRVGFPVPLGRSGAMRRSLSAFPAPDVFHLHGAWLRAMHYAAGVARHRRVPYLVEMMGMYEPYGLALKPWRKRVARFWFQDRILREAACLHVSSLQEAENIRALGFKPPIAIIPVGVNLDSILSAQKAAPVAAPWKQLDGCPFVLFLSRIHEKKGIELLLQAWAAVQGRQGAGKGAGWVLVIAGTGDPAYVARCRAMADELGVANSCLWPGSLTELEKTWSYSNAGLFVLPSYSENYGNVVAEALAYGTPVITTTGTPWKTLGARNCGWTIEPDREALTKALLEALNLGFANLRSLGRYGVDWCRSEFTLELVNRDIELVYDYVRGGSKPPCVL